MPKIFKPGWEYVYANDLKMELAINLSTGLIYCEDKTIYKPGEANILSKENQNITLGIHNVKRLFGGEIIRFIKQ